ncbi:hypothetical protein BDV37DRAFT_287429 [Aspergillus pseudonomiae]|uniref:Uncharacterized protein n=1 Tax=Aspergillus pseudonomiae TaxID=1506151 RepID=A0A5N7D187_9EURO|nr:uncharacterized protein BDV37DRAFT_287429 [Aspergillus pseudonomiae]KAE8399598.1 hypothetical protein BDV37DRAFT_287429 [Aspergillus pseudonomiae]
MRCNDLSPSSAVHHLLPAITSLARVPDGEPDYTESWPTVVCNNGTNTTDYADFVQKSSGGSGRLIVDYSRPAFFAVTPGHDLQRAANAPVACPPSKPEQDKRTTH